MTTEKTCETCGRGTLYNDKLISCWAADGCLMEKGCVQKCWTTKDELFNKQIDNIFRVDADYWKAREEDL